jgi:hypothetical protein
MLLHTRLRLDTALFLVLRTPHPSVFTLSTALIKVFNFRSLEEACISFDRVNRRRSIVLLHIALRLQPLKLSVFRRGTGTARLPGFALISPGSSNTAPQSTKISWDLSRKHPFHLNEWIAGSRQFCCTSHLGFERWNLVHSRGNQLPIGTISRLRIVNFQGARPLILTQIFWKKQNYAFYLQCDNLHYTRSWLSESATRH